MRSTSERVAAVETRTRELKQRRLHRHNTVVVWLSAAACLLLILTTALTMPDLMARQSTVQATYSSAAASVFAKSSAAGYALIGLLAFLLGCCVTILCYRLRRREREARNDRNRR